MTFELQVRKGEKIALTLLILPFILAKNCRPRKVRQKASFSEKKCNNNNLIKKKLK
jgi:hypothetical protein